MNGDIWRSREAETLAKYAERLRAPDDAETDGDEQNENEPATVQNRISANRSDEIDFSYMNGPPPKDLLNYKNMEIEMALWAKTGTGWMSVWILLVLMVACFILTCLLWLIRGTIY